MNNKAIFNLSWAGNLGDNLLFTTLPKLYDEIGVKFYLQNKTIFRNEEIKKLVWDLNPYVNGMTDELANIVVNKEIILNVRESNCIQNVEVVNGFKNSGNKYPVIYYEPQIIDFLIDKTILALNTISQGIYYNDEYIYQILKPLIGKDDNVLLLNYKKSISPERPDCLGCFNYNTDIYYVEDIFHHCDIIASSKRYITLQSGSAVLGSAIVNKTNKNNVEVILSKTYTNLAIRNKVFYFDNLIYRY